MNSILRPTLSSVAAVREADHPVLGLRQWRIAMSHGRVELGALFQSSVWLEMDQPEAHCPDGHRAGATSCDCGFHLLHVNGESAAELENTMLSGNPVIVTGIAAGWGRLAISPMEIRCQYARPTALFLHAHHDDTYRSLIAALAGKYGAETTDVTGAMDLLGQVKSREGVISPTALDQLLRDRPIILQAMEPELFEMMGDHHLPWGYWPEERSLPYDSQEVQLPDSPGDLAVLPVAGMNFQSGRQRKNLDRFLPGREIRLVPEPENRFDHNAVAVFDSTGEVQLGYLPRVIAPTFDRDRIATSRAWVLCHWSGRPDTEPAGAHLAVIGSRQAKRLVFDGRPEGP